MFTRPSLLFAGAAMFALSTTANAQNASEVIAAEVVDLDPYEARSHHPADPQASPDGRLGYTMAEREAWLADCRLLMADGGGFDDYGYYRDDYYGDRDADGGLVGGLLGAIVGGVAGNRIGDGDRLAGTLIGAGLGGVAGAVIGSVIENAEDEEEARYHEAHLRADEANALWAARYCDAYLRRYEMGGPTGLYPEGHGQTVMLVQAVAAPSHSRHGEPGHRHDRTCTTTVREEWAEADQPDPPARREIPPREPDGKLLPVN